MILFNKIYSFRVRIALIFTLTLVATIVVLYKLNQAAEHSIISEVNQQRQDLAKAINIAQQSLSSSQWLYDFLKERRAQDTQSGHHHVQRILIVNTKNEVEDSSNLNDIKKPFSELGFGDLVQSNDIEIPFDQKVEKNTPIKPYQIFRFPVQTSSGMVNLVIIFSTENLTEQLQTFSRYRLIITGSVLFISILISLFLVLEFTRPVDKLMKAAKQIASGDFNVYLPTDRRDELGRLMAVFNEMVKGLSERQGLETRLLRAEQSASLGRLASGIAHELKNPLNYISLTIDYLWSKNASLSKEAKELFYEKMASIKDEIKRMDRLIRSFLKYGRPLDLNFKPVDVREIISNILTNTKEQAAHQSIDQICDMETQIPIIEADAEELRSCFSNLILNAYEAMPNGGQLRIDCYCHKNEVEITIADTGNGIDSEPIERIFEPYFSTKEIGTGLGLAIVKRIIESHNGQISIESSLGVGTTFYIRLPFSPRQSLSSFGLV